MNITVTHQVTLSPETLSLVESFLKGFTSAPKVNGQDKLKKEKEPAATGKASSEKKVTIEQVREVVSRKAAAGKKAEIKALLSVFDVANVTSLPDDKLPEFLEKVEAL